VIMKSCDLDLECEFITANCNNSAYPYMCTPCCDSHVQCSFDYQGFVRTAFLFLDVTNFYRDTALDPLYMMAVA